MVTWNARKRSKVTYLADISDNLWAVVRMAFEENADTEL
jgi:hypothetical protein